MCAYELENEKDRKGHEQKVVNFPGPQVKSFYCFFVRFTHQLKIFSLIGSKETSEKPLQILLLYLSITKRKLIE